MNNYDLPNVRGVYRFNAELKNWFDVPAKAEILFRPADIEDLQNFLKWRAEKSEKFPLTILGAASNVIIKDRIKGVVIKLGGEFAKIFCEGEIIRAGAAALCGNVALSAKAPASLNNFALVDGVPYNVGRRSCDVEIKNYSKNSALENLEFLTGIPGSIGGAIAMNAGCYGSDISQILVTVKAVDFAGNLIELSNADCKFSYRKNAAAENLIFVEALFKGVASNSEIISEKISKLNKQREKAQPIRAKTGGSTFKNPYPNDANSKKAWQLIDEAGCRAMICGDAQISEKHCNFMINKGQASANDLIDLGNKVQKLVKEKTGVNLEWEIKILG
jgi:UDP-N-acetylmuramate dehydrogenase